LERTSQALRSNLSTQASKKDGERSSLRMHIATTESVSLCAQMKSWLRFWKSNQRFAERA
jgi:hypothetical protein